jgi:hypothetical protein
MRIAKPLLLLILLLPVVTVRVAAEPLLEQLRLDHAAWEAAAHDFRTRREHGVLTGAEASEYAAYVARLQRRVAEDCAALAGAGLTVPDDLSCPRIEAAALIRPAAIDQAAEQSREEHIAGLDAELTRGLADFDELLLREQDRVKASAPRSAASGGTGRGEYGSDGNGKGAGGADSADGAAPAGDTEAGSDSAGGGSRPQAGSSTDRSSTGAGGGPVKAGRHGATRQPPGIPDGSDDDVVARQLREAAEKETDPELQKKLWEEYRKYKQGIR